MVLYGLLGGLPREEEWYGLPGFEAVSGSCLTQMSSLPVHIMFNILISTVSLLSCICALFSLHGFLLHLWSYVWLARVVGRVCVFIWWVGEQLSRDLTDLSTPSGSGEQ